MSTKKQKACLTKEFSKLKKKRTMPQKQKVAIALSVCKVPKKIGSTDIEISKLRQKKDELSKQFNDLAQLKKRLYSKIDISMPKSKAEKELDEKVAKIGSEMNKTILEIRKLLK